MVFRLRIFGVNLFKMTAFSKIPFSNRTQSYGFYSRSAKKIPDLQSIAASPLARLTKDTVSLRFGKVDGPAPASFLRQYEELPPAEFQIMERRLIQRQQARSPLEELQRQIPATRDDAPGLEIVEVGAPFGKALRTTRAFPKGETVIHFNIKDTQTQNPAFYLASLDQLHQSDPVMALSHYVVVSDHSGLTWPNSQKISYLNHAEGEGDKANVEVSYAKHGYVATRDIRKGEVIFSDYNTGEYSTPKNDQAFDCWHDFAKAK